MNFDFDDEMIEVVMLAAFKQKNKKDIFEKVYLQSLIDAFSRIPKELRKEEKIRDALTRDLENENPLTKDLIARKYLFVSIEQLKQLSETEKSRADIVFSTMGLEFVIECKRLQSAETVYLEEGIKRFIDLKYAEKDDFAGMLGFIIGGNPEKIVANLKEKVKTYHPSKDMEKWLAKTCAEHDLSFQSKHLRSNNTEIHIFHLFFDLSA